LTFEGVAQAFGERVSPHPEMVKLCKEFFGTDDLKSPKLKLAFIPESSELCYGIDKTTGSPGRYPVVKVRNVFVLPGIPKLLMTAFDRLEEVFSNPAAEFRTREVYIAVDEASITGILNEVNAKFKDRVILGSYPDFYNSYYKVKLNLEATQASDLDEIYAFLKEKLPAKSISMSLKKASRSTRGNRYALDSMEEKIALRCYISYTPYLSNIELQALLHLA
jgi:FAD synthetase